MALSTVSPELVSTISRVPGIPIRSTWPCSICCNGSPTRYWAKRILAEPALMISMVGLLASKKLSPGIDSECCVVAPINRPGIWMCQAESVRLMLLPNNKNLSLLFQKVTNFPFQDFCGRGRLGSVSAAAPSPSDFSFHFRLIVANTPWRLSFK